MTHAALLPHVWTEDFAEGHLAGFSSYPPFEDTAYDFTILPGRVLDPLRIAGYVGSGEYYYPAGLTPPPGGAGFVLRSWRATSGSAQRLGFMRELRLNVGAGSRLSFAWWVKLTPHAARLRIELAGGNGRIYTHLLEAGVREAWASAELPLDAFRAGDAAPPPGLAIEAITLIAEFEQGDPATFHVFAIGALRLECLRPAQVEFLTPGGMANPHWPAALADRFVHPAEALALHVRPELEARAAVAELWDFARGTRLAALELAPQGDGTWRSLAPLPLDSIEPGPLELRINALAAPGAAAGDTSGRQPEARFGSSLRVWLLEASDPAAGLLFAASELPALRARAHGGGRGTAIWERVAQEAAAARAALPPREAPFERFPPEQLLPQLLIYFNTLRDGARAAQLNALVFAIEGDAEAGAFARECLVRMTGWAQWIHPAFQTQGRPTYYPVGMTALRLGIAFDLLRETLSPDERAACREGLLRNLIRPACAEYYERNRINNHTSNWISHSVGGALVALVALESEMQDAGGRAEFVRLFGGLAEKFIAHARATIKPDGSYGEGFSYQNFAMETSWPVLGTLAAHYGVRSLARALHFDRSFLFAHAISFHAGCDLLDMGDADDKRVDPVRPLGSDRVQYGRSDSGANRVTSSNWAWLLRETRDPHLKWFYDCGAGNAWEDFLWLDESIPSAAPETRPLRQHFADKGNVVLRSGWGERDTLLVLRAGANYNHTHADQGSFRLRYAGRELACEGGKSSYYTDTYYWSYFIQAASHNIVLVDDNPESQEIGDFIDGPRALDRHARMTQVLLEGPLAFVRSELAPVYRGALAQYTRTLIQLPGGELVVHDQLRAQDGAEGSAAHTFQWQLHPPSAECVRLGAADCAFELADAALRIVPAAPAERSVRLKPVPIPINEFDSFPATPPAPRGVLQIANAAPAAECEFIVLLAPFVPDEPEAAAHTQGWTAEERGFRRRAGAETPGVEDYAEWFACGPNARIGSMLESDAAYAWLRGGVGESVSRAADGGTGIGRLQGLALIGATRATLDGTPCLAAEHPLAFFIQSVVSPERGSKPERRCRIHTEQANRLRLTLPSGVTAHDATGNPLAPGANGLDLTLGAGWFDFTLDD